MAIKLRHRTGGVMTGEEEGWDVRNRTRKSGVLIEDVK